MCFCFYVCERVRSWCSKGQMYWLQVLGCSPKAHISFSCGTIDIQLKSRGGKHVDYPWGRQQGHALDMMTSSYIKCWFLPLQPIVCSFIHDYLKKLLKVCIIHQYKKSLGGCLYRCSFTQNSQAVKTCWKNKYLMFSFGSILPLEDYFIDQLDSCGCSFWFLVTGDGLWGQYLLKPSHSWDFAHNES